MSPVKKKVRSRPRAASRNTTSSSSTSRSRTNPRGRLRTPVRRRTGSRTKTGVKNEHVKTSRDGPVSSSISKIRVKGGFKLGKFRKLTAPMFFISNNANSISWTDGFQVATQSDPLYGTADLKSMFAMYATNIPATTTGVATTRLYMKSVFTETLITNQTNDVVHMTLYDVMCRRDLTTSSTAEANYVNPNAAWVQGSIDAGNSGAFQIVASTPFQTPGFTEYWKIVKITDVDLHSGGHHRHRVLMKPKKQISNEIVTTLSASSNTGTLGGLTVYTMIVCHGFPVNSTGTSTTSTASGKIDWVSRKQYEFYPIGSERTIITQVDNLPSLGTESFINDLTGIAAVITTA